MDSLVLAEELSKASEPEKAFESYRRRRFERCRYIVDISVAICNSQLGKGPSLDQARLTREFRWGRLETLRRPRCQR